MLAWKEKVACLMISILINLGIVYLYGKFISPVIRDASKGIAILIIQNQEKAEQEDRDQHAKDLENHFRRENSDRSVQAPASPSEPTK